MAQIKIYGWIAGMKHKIKTPYKEVLRQFIEADENNKDKDLIYHHHKDDDNTEYFQVWKSSTNKLLRQYTVER